MKRKDADLERLLRSAAAADDSPASEAPFGFETRVLSAWRAANGQANDAVELTRFLRRIGAVALVVLILATTGVYRELNEFEDRTTPQTNEYAIADATIQSEFLP